MDQIFFLLLLGIVIPAHCAPMNSTALQRSSTSRRLQSEGNCRDLNIKFIVQTGDAELAAMEDDIRADLAAIGISVETEFLQKDDFNAAMTGGEFNLCVCLTASLSTWLLLQKHGQTSQGHWCLQQMLLGDMGPTV